MDLDGDHGNEAAVGEVAEQLDGNGEVEEGYDGDEGWEEVADDDDDEEGDEDPFVRKIRGMLLQYTPQPCCHSNLYLCHADDVFNALF